MCGGRLSRVAGWCLTLFVLCVAACGGDDDAPDQSPTAEPPPPAIAATSDPAPSPTRAVPTLIPLPTSTATPSPIPTPAPPAVSTPTPTVTATATPPAALEPRGFPLDPALRTGLVTGTVGTRRIEWGAGPAVEVYSREEQASADPGRANRAGWNCRTHQEYEARPAVDWYLPVGTPVLATMDGTATLVLISVSNPFDLYAVSREPYLGDPDRDRAPQSPFPGPGGGKGVFVRVTNERFVTEYAHLDLAPTLAVVPTAAYLPGFGADADYATRFRPLRAFNDETPVARWNVRRGDVIGFVGDSGYSEAPHLHYTVARAGGGLLCPTSEAGFADGGWLLR